MTHAAVFTGIFGLDLAKIGILYNSLELSSQKALLKEMVERIVVNAEGTIIEVRWLPPFAYLRDISSQVYRADNM